jgi:plastocyanin
MHTLDSRHLNLGNCFGQRFPKVGEVHYFVSLGETIPGAAARSEGGHIITVRPARVGVAPEQRDVVVSVDNGSLSVAPSRLEIYAGDSVLWYTASPQVTGFQVAGYGPNFEFNSARMQDDAVYTHAFGTPGSYEWHDPNGSGASGIVNVEGFSHKGYAGNDRWFELLTTPATFEINGNKSSPASVDIVVGQTVFWSISKSPGIAVSDKRLYRAPSSRQSV